ncbi:MAG TPA: hypothetical protein VKT30_09905 [Caulobacteraceae bacterium]|nr:hypothetical protein [Caulobacteraceae bacterium]
MTNLKTTLVHGALAASMAFGVVAATAGAASADVVCNRWGDCWRVHEHYTTYPPAVGITFHTDDWWATHPRGHWRWHDRPDDNGYYRDGVWISF